ncbi:thiol-disulfide oxidoreductase DCC family protein [Nocardiopsis alkaliphila]|uniref:thiol-disulfide oxidoreductase DCC family protein n=1 Tax=Nocardiopsis alkaliphila TaxID=225762 RepID=UPI0003713072|nr:DCC1-like thiol-disulfide oxidoreductase family protein [Nocardiopsis alkaliphila]
MSNEPNVNETPTPGLFLYDRDCGFCRRSVSFARERVRSQVVFAAWQAVDLKVFGLTPEQTREQAWLARSDGDLLAGGDAVAEVLRHGRFPFRVLGRLLGLPGLRSLNRVAYRVVAANRHRIPGGVAARVLPTRNS